LLSQSNAAAAIESGVTTENTLRRQILDETAVFFPRGGRADTVFGIRAWTAVSR
jgi:hypothetical protein